MNRHAPLDNIKIKGSNLPYITSEIRQLVRLRDYLREKANKTGSRYLRQAFQQIKHKVTYKIRQARSEYSRRINENQGDIKGTWKVLKQAINKGPKMADISTVNYNSELVTDKNKIPEVFNDHFVGVGEKLATDISPSTCSSSDYIFKVNTNGSRFEFKLLKPVDVYKVFSKLKNGKAAGMHLIPNRILKNVKDILTPSITDIFNASIKSKTFPDHFKIARVTPIFKEGDTEDLGNYRPISILASIARIFERLLYKQLHDFLATNKILNDKQWGFRSLHSTALALIDCSTNWLLNIDKAVTNLTVFLDIKKAFDTIDHSILLEKLRYCGIMGGELDFFRSYLRNRKQCCNVNGQLSSIKNIRYGVPQGSILGPLLFILYMNDLPCCVENGYITMYADDTSLSNSVKTCEDISEKVIPNMLQISDWLKANKLSPNVI